MATLDHLHFDLDCVVVAGEAMRTFLDQKELIDRQLTYQYSQIAASPQRRIAKGCDFKALGLPVLELGELV
ncbi:hypothetical protein D3C76_1665180 [compost metagenome]